MYTVLGLFVWGPLISCMIDTSNTAYRLPSIRYHHVPCRTMCMRLMYAPGEERADPHLGLELVARLAPRRVEEDKQRLVL